MYLTAQAYPTVELKVSLVYIGVEVLFKDIMLTSINTKHSVTSIDFCFIKGRPGADTGGWSRGQRPPPPVVKGGS